MKKNFILIILTILLGTNVWCASATFSPRDDTASDGDTNKVWSADRTIGAIDDAVANAGQNALNYNCSGSATTTTGSITTGTSTLVVASADTFAVNQGIRINGAGTSGGILVTTITNIDGTTITLEDNASTTVSGETVMHDDTAAINALFTSNARVYFPGGTYRHTSPLFNIGGITKITIRGDGPATTFTTDQDIDSWIIGDYVYSGSNDLPASPRVANYDIGGFRIVSTSSTKTNANGMVLRDTQTGIIHDIIGYHVKNVIVVNPQTAWTRFSNIMGIGIDGSTSPLENTIKIQGDGYTINYNSTGNIYENIVGESVKNAIIYFTGATFGDAVITGVNGYGCSSGGNGVAGGAIAAIYINQPNGTYVSGSSTYYCSRITISSVVMDGVADYVLKSIMGNTASQNTGYVFATNFSKGGNVTDWVSYTGGWYMMVFPPLSEGYVYSADSVHNISGVDLTPSGHLWLDGAGGWPSTTSGCAAETQTETSTNKQNYFTLDFDASTQEYAQFETAMPSDWDGGTITAQFYWLANDTSTNSVIWGLQAVSYGDGSAIDASWGTAQEVTDANASTANQVRISSATSAITVGGTPTGGKFVMFRVYRKAAAASDTLTVDASLLGILVTYGRE